MTKREALIEMMQTTETVLRTVTDDLYADVRRQRMVSSWLVVFKMVHEREATREDMNTRGIPTWWLRRPDEMATM